MSTRTLTPRLAASDKLLSYSISLPKDALISCFIYSPLAGPSSHSRAYSDILEVARREVLTRNQSGSATLTHSILTSVHIRGMDSCMYAFCIGKQGEDPTELTSLHFDGLIVTSRISFAPSDTYPCCSSCFDLATPCSSCSEPSSSASHHHLPRQSLRLVYSHFLQAIRLRLVSDISNASNSSQTGRKRLAKGLKGGFLLDPPPSSTEWSKGWDAHASCRPLIYCQLQIDLSSYPEPQLIVHPQLHTTPFLVLPHGPGRPLAQGAPIILLPHGTPAFYLAPYSGPTSGLRRQFHDSLRGLGVSGWDVEEDADDHWFSSKNPTERQETKFIIAWISVENKQGEDKGISIIYPSSLCLSFAPCSTATLACWAGRREPLAYIPELPAQLQPSPQVSAAAPPPSLFSPSTQTRLQSPFRPSSCPATPAPHALRAFRAFTRSRSRGLRHTAAEVNGYVDAVTKEREKERERLRRERERDGGSPRLGRASTSGTTSVTNPAATPTSVPPATPQSAIASAPPTVPQPAASASQQQVGQGPTAFYPSPPQADTPLVVPLNDGRTSPVTSTGPPIVPAAPQPTTLPPAVVPPQQPPVQVQQQQPQTFDPFGDQSYMDIDMAMNDFGSMSGMIDMGMGMNFSMSGAGTDRQREASLMDYDADFTEDDFSFFDHPVVPHAPLPLTSETATSMTEQHHFTSGLTPAAGPAPLSFGGLPGMSPPLFAESPAQHGLHGDWAGSNVFTPGPEMHHMMNAIPELLPPSPGDTPYSHAASAPATPNVQLAEDDHTLVRRASSSGLSFGIFDPIPFAQSHRVADGKYVVGKFALPSPPPESDDETLYEDAPAQDGWRFKYALKTDPRIGVVRKLIGVKRKTTTMLNGRSSKMSPAWVREHEDWEQGKHDDGEEARSEPESDEDEEMEEDSPLVSRPSTPPPAYLPLGPTLLHTHFQHSHLLPLSTPLRPPGAAVAPTNITTMTVASASVPTPVSPAATLGAASEKSKSLEAAAFAVGKEVVENCVWAEVWRTNVVNLGAKAIASQDAVWPTDVKTAAQLLGRVPDVQGPLDVETLFGLEVALAKSNSTPPKSESSPAKALRVLDSPMISIGKGNSVIQILPTALRFWEKLGLTPRGGRKDAIVYVLFEDDGDTRQQLAEAWLTKTLAIYESKHLGTLTPGSHQLCVKDGLLSLRFDSTFRKSLAAFVSGLTAPFRSNVVFYVVTPHSTMSLASPLLRQMFSAAKKALQAHEEFQSIFQFVPDALVAFSSSSNPVAQAEDFEAVCYSTYDRILQPVERVMSRRFFEHGEPLRRYFHDPAYTLARSPLPATVKYVQRTNAPLDVVDAGTFLHVGYSFSECGKWILCACVDQRGEAHDLAVWLTQTQVPHPDGEDGEVETFTHAEYAVRKVWDFACGFAKRASVSWRIVFSKLGAMSVADLDAWMSFLAKAVPNCTALSDVHVSLMSVEPDAPWTFLPHDHQVKAITASPLAAPPSASGSSTPSSNNKLHPSLPMKPLASRIPSSSSIKTPTLFVDVSSTTYAIYPKRTLSLALPPTPLDLGLSLGFVPESTPSCSGSPTTATPSPEVVDLTASTPQSQLHTPGGPGSSSGSTGSSVHQEYPHPLPLRPLSTALLVRVPAPSIASTPTVLHVNMLAVFPQPSHLHASDKDSISKLHAEITENFHELAVLSAARWRKLGGGLDSCSSSLPFHLAAVDKMRGALGRDGVSTVL
ncbi:mediator of RNA polymerase II transcription subunit 13 [Favolaschia claudopus]|uniref:Mediator of RNA polymerase II transcription subunit 13 n=1 Tax=Favolaschia claudopus TaxID=2862362 RepID=A0AAW0DYM0_9AGAR